MLGAISGPGIVVVGSDTERRRVRGRNAVVLRLAASVVSVGAIFAYPETWARVGAGGAGAAGVGVRWSVGSFGIRCWSR